MQLELFENQPFAVRLQIGDAFRIFFEAYWSKTVKGQSTSQAIRRIQTFFNQYGINYVDEVSRLSVEDMRRSLLENGFKPATVNSHHMIVTRLFYWLEESKEAGIVNGIDFRKLVLPKKNPGSLVSKVNEAPFARRVAWSKKDILKLIDAAHRVSDQLMADIIESLYITLLRPGDLFHMTKRNIDIPHLLVTGIQHKTITRRLPSGIPYTRAITPRLKKILIRRINEAPKDGFIFRDDVVTTDAWRTIAFRRFKAIRDYAKLPWIQLRDFRPSAATLQLDNGTDPVTVSEGLGHTTLRMLPIYARRTIRHQLEAQKKIEDISSEILS